MPELPEVEVTRRQVARVLNQAVIVDVWTSPPSYFFVSSPAVIRRKLRGRRVQALTRQGKYLLAELDDGSRLLLHLGMTGQLTTQSSKLDHVHLRLTLDSGHIVTFRDVRKFGKVEWLPPGRSSPRLDKLGPDALVIRPAEFFLRLSKRKLPVKQALLNQSVLAGVGNIYADEALFHAGISPLRPGSSLSLPEAARLLREVQKVLKASILQGGSTINDYLKPDGELGGFQHWHRVYGRTGEPCSKCRAPIVRIVLGGRASHYCEGCQGG
jgi:formamidopyrimidine-DNA glycosylase